MDPSTTKLINLAASAIHHRLTSDGLPAAVSSLIDVGPYALPIMSLLAVRLTTAERNALRVEIEEAIAASEERLHPTPEQTQALERLAASMTDPT